MSKGHISSYNTIVSNNKNALLEEKFACCIHCIVVFPTHIITDWTDNGETAICPLCFVDAIAPFSAIPNSETVRKWHKEAFGK